MTIVSYLPQVFSDEALEGYNYNGASTLGRSKLAMRAYEIFSNCFVGKREVLSNFFWGFEVYNIFNRWFFLQTLGIECPCS